MRRSSQALSHLVLGLGALVMAGPFAWQAVTSVKTLAEATAVPPVLWPAGPSAAAYADFFASIPFWTMLASSTGALLLRVGGQVIFCALAAYAFARLRFPGRKTLFVLFLAVLMVPSQLFLIPQYEVMKSLGWLDSVQALAIPGMFSAFGTFLLRQFFLALPEDYEEAARLDGANPPQIFWHIMLPLAKPGLVALAVLTSLYSWNDLLWPLVVNTSPEMMTLPVGLATLQGQHGTDYPVLMAGALIVSLPMLLLFLFLQRYFIRSIAFTGVKG
jgi:multiple sugar transport system permease protein